MSFGCKSGEIGQDRPRFSLNQQEFCLDVPNFRFEIISLTGS
jgi:hypothetical protein